MDGLHVEQMIDPARLAPGGEFPRSLAVGFAGMEVADIGGEEFEDPPRGANVGREEGGERKAWLACHRNQIMRRR